MKWIRKNEFARGEDAIGPLATMYRGIRKKEEREIWIERNKPLSVINHPVKFAVDEM